MQVEFYLAGETTQVVDAIPWVRCASGNVSFAARPRQLGFYKCFQLTIANKAVTQLLLAFINVLVLLVGVTFGVVQTYTGVPFAFNVDKNSFHF